MSKLADQRKFTRVPIGYRIKLMSEAKTIVCPAAVNISMNGILVRAPEHLPLGTRCHVIIFVLEDGIETKILAWGTVVRSNREGMAIRFAQILGEKGHLWLKNLILCRCPDPEQAVREFESSVLQMG